MISYVEVLEKIKGQENHLLLANGFNLSLGIGTSYKKIFEKMINNHDIYKDAVKMVEECDFDLECFIGKLEKDISENSDFIKKYVNNKVKLDFMQATHEIVKAEIKNVYAEKNEGIFLLLKEFTDYLTLNYDMFLYLILMKYKPATSKNEDSIAFQQNIKFIEEDLNTTQNNIYREIKEARENGQITINFGEADTVQKELNKITKTYFVETVSTFSKANNKGWTGKDIERVVKQILEEEKENLVLTKVDDGSRREQVKMFKNEEYVFDTTSTTQNLFFLHGAFHIYKDGQDVKKITQEKDKALYEKLENILNHGEQDVVCVFQHENKTDAINNNTYLKHCFNKLKQLTGNLVIIGSSLADNDNHIFNEINSSPVSCLYISAFGDEDKIRELSETKFPDKEIILFDAKTISYERPQKIQE